MCNSTTRPLFRFPKKPERMRLWLQKIDKFNLLECRDEKYIFNNARLCQAHFDETSFTSSLRTKLLPFSVPTDIRIVEVEEKAVQRNKNNLRPPPELQPILHPKTCNVNILDVRPSLLATNLTILPVNGSVAVTKPVLKRETYMMCHSTTMPLFQFPKEPERPPPGYQPILDPKIYNESILDVPPSLLSTDLTSRPVNGSVVVADVKPVFKREACVICNSTTRPLFRFPKKRERMRLWLQKIDKFNLLECRDELYIFNNARLCHAHFDDTSFTSSLRTKLLPFSVPKDARIVEVEEKTVHRDINNLRK